MDTHTDLKIASPPSFGAMLGRSFERFPGSVAVQDGARSLTYGELGDRSARFSDALRNAGARRGDRVAILLENKLEFFEVDTALTTGGYVRVALNVRLHDLEVVQIIRDCRAHTVVTDAVRLEKLLQLLDEIPSVANVVAVAGRSAGSVVEYEEFVSSGAPAAPDPPRPDELWGLLYTSGTTGLPKGVMMTHANWAAYTRNAMTELPEFDLTDSLVHAGPLSHWPGYVGHIFSLRGARHVVLPGFDSGNVLRTIESEGITVLPVVPTMINDLVDVAEDASPDVSSVRIIVYGGAAIAPSRLARAVGVFGRVFVQMYGLSEGPMPMVSLRIPDHDFEPGHPLPSRLRSAGRVNPFVELKLLEPGGGDNQVPVGEVGEIVVRGDTVMPGYWDNPDATNEVLAEDGWLRTGDLGMFDEEGFLTIVDRRKDMIVSGGFNVYPAEIENVIAKLDDVIEVAVVGVPDERFGEAVKAVVVLRPGSALDAEAIRGACADELARFKIPRSVDFLDALPKTGSGKVLRRTLREQYWAGQERRVGGV